MTRNLRIGTMELELECASTSQERRVLEWIRSTIDTGILDALDHRLASCLPTEGVYRIDSLEIDLGTISEADLSRDLGDRLVRVLEPELMRRIPACVPEQPSLQAWTVLGERLSSRELARLLDQGERMALVASRKDAVLDHVTGLVDLLDQGKLGVFSPTVIESLWEILLDAALDVCRMDDAWRSRIEAALGLPWARLQERLSPANADGAIRGRDAMETMTNPVISSSIGSWDASLGIDAEASGGDLECSSMSRDDNGPVAIPNARIQDALLCSAADVEGDGGVDSLESSSTAASNRIDLEVDSDAGLVFSRTQLLEQALERGDAPRLESLVPFVSSDVTVLRAVLMRSRLDRRLRRRLRELPASVLESMTAVAASQLGDVDTSVSAPSLYSLLDELLGTDRDEAVSSATAEDDQTGFASLGGDLIEVDQICQELSESSNEVLSELGIDVVPETSLELPRAKLLELALERGDAVRLECLVPFVLSDVTVLHALLMRARLDQRLRRRLLDLPVSVLESMAAIAASQSGDMETSESLHSLVEKILGTDACAKEQKSIGTGAPREDGLTDFASPDGNSLDGSEHSRAHRLMLALERGDARRLTGLFPFVPSDADVLRAVLLRSRIDRRLRRRLRDLPEELLKDIVAVLPKAEREDAMLEKDNMTESVKSSEACDPCEPQERSAASDAVAPMRLLKALVSVLDGSASADALPLEIEDALKMILLEKECRNALLRLLLVSEPILRRLAEVASDEDWYALLAARHGAGLEVLESCRLRVQEALGQVLSGSQAPSLEVSWRMCMMQRPVLEAGAAPLRICRDLLMVLGRENPALPVAKALSLLERQLARERPDLFLEEAWKKARAAVSAREGGIEGVVVDNAGLVLLGPYLPRLFGMFSLLGEDGFVDLGAKIHAVRVLQFLIHGSAEARQESLPLCRILCGLPPGVPVGEEPIPPQEQEVCEQLLEAVIQHWSILGSTSVPGLRETFLRRNGTLESREEQWLLRVETGAFDMLLDKLPWGYKTVRFGWMDKTLQVEWR